VASFLLLKVVLLRLCYFSLALLGVVVIALPSKSVVSAVWSVAPTSGSDTGSLEPRGPRHDTLDRADDIVKFQTLLQQTQSPLDCKEARLLIVPFIRVPGLGSAMHSRLHAMQDAFLSNRTLVAASGSLYPYVNPMLCPEEDYNCYFLPTTSCTMEDVGQSEARGNDTFGLDRVVTWKRKGGKNLSNATELSQPYGMGWFHKELTRFLFRPNSRLQATINKLSSQLGLEGGYVSMHYRSGFILKTEGKRQPLELFVRVLKRLKEKLLPVHKVFFMSDDPNAIDDIRAAAPGFDIVTVEAALFASSKASPKQHIIDFLTNYQWKGDEDEALMVSAVMFLLGGGDYAIAALSSNLGRTTYELMGTKQFPPHFYDVDNDIWFDGGVGPANMVCTGYGHSNGK
jgi:hypothetical protein